MSKLSAFTLQSVCDTANLGLMILNPDKRVVLWNRWLVERSGIEHQKAIDQRLGELFDEPLTPIFLNCIDRALQYGLPIIMSNALHRAPIPLYRDEERSARSRIDQSIVLSSIRSSSGERCCMVQIVDASASIKREDILRAYSRKHRQDATTDSLTGISNRRSFDEYSAVALAQAQKNKKSLSIFLIDIDYFKQYNDCYGHLAGDRTLKFVATTLNAQVLRSTDLVARYGGEEFVVVMVGLKLEQVHHFAEKMRQAVAGCELPHSRSAVAEHITISIGACTGIPDDGEEMKSLLNKADQALYQAKHNGRNQVAFVVL